MIIREYHPADGTAVLEFDGRSSERRRAKFRLVERCHESFYSYVAEKDGKICGFVIMEDLGDGNHYMLQINTFPKHKGTGTKLASKVFERVGMGHVSLCVNTNNPSAIAFYEYLGFIRSGESKNYRRGQDKFWYSLDLANTKVQRSLT